MLSGTCVRAINLRQGFLTNFLWGFFDLRDLKYFLFILPFDKVFSVTTRSRALARQVLSGTCVRATNLRQGFLTNFL